MGHKKNTAALRSTQLDDQLKQFKDALNEGMSVKPAKAVLTPVYTHDAKVEIGTDGFALSLLEDTLPTWLPEWFQRKLKNSLRGFNEEAALWIAEGLMDCYSGQALTTTGIKHIDDLLWSLYSEILYCARQKGIKLANHH